MRIFVILITLWIFVFSTGCQAIPVEGETSSETISTPVAPPNEGEPAQMSTSMPIPSDAGLQNLIDKARTDLANRLAISVDQIVLLEATSVVWPDASLGCPQTGMVYIQVPEDGLLIKLQAGDQIYPYHSGGFRDPFLCKAIVKDPGKPPQIDFFNLTRPAPGSGTPDNNVPPGGDN